MNSPNKTFTILLANDDEDLCLLIREALEEVALTINIYSVKDGEEILDYLYRRDRFNTSPDSPRPHLILLDINMPKVSGLEALSTIKSDPQLRQIPVLILTTSHQQADILRSYQLGANSFISKPITFEGLVNVMNGLCHYWFEIACLVD